MTRSETDEPMLCTLDGIDPEGRERHRELGVAVRERLVGVEELADGLALRYAMDSEFFLRLAEWATLERQCCPFLTLGLHLPSGEGAMELRLTGGEGVKAFLDAEVGRRTLDEFRRVLAEGEGSPKPGPIS